MPRSSYIYHLYKHNNRILSATVKQEIISQIHQNGWTNEDYSLMASGDNSLGEYAIAGWRHMPKKGDKVILLLTQQKIDRALDITPKGYWTVYLENCGQVKYKVKWDGGDTWVIVS